MPVKTIVKKKKTSKRKNITFKGKVKSCNEALGSLLKESTLGSKVSTEKPLLDHLGKAVLLTQDKKNKPISKGKKNIKTSTPHHTKVRQCSFFSTTESSLLSPINNSDDSSSTKIRVGKKRSESQNKMCKRISNTNPPSDILVNKENQILDPNIFPSRDVTSDNKQIHRSEPNTRNSRNRRRVSFKDQDKPAVSNNNIMSPVELQFPGRNTDYVNMTPRTRNNVLNMEERTLSPVRVKVALAKDTSSSTVKGIDSTTDPQNKSVSDKDNIGQQVDDNKFIMFRRSEHQVKNNSIELGSIPERQNKPRAKKSLIKELHSKPAPDDDVNTNIDSQQNTCNDIIPMTEFSDNDSITLVRKSFRLKKPSRKNVQALSPYKKRTPNENNYKAITEMTKKSDNNHQLESSKIGLNMPSRGRAIEAFTKKCKSPPSTFASILSEIELKKKLFNSNETIKKSAPLQTSSHNSDVVNQVIHDDVNLSGAFNKVQRNNALDSLCSNAYESKEMTEPELLRGSSRADTPITNICQMSAQTTSNYVSCEEYGNLAFQNINSNIQKKKFWDILINGMELAAVHVDAVYKASEARKRRKIKRSRRTYTEKLNRLESLIETNIAVGNFNMGEVRFHSERKVVVRRSCVRKGQARMTKERLQKLYDAGWLDSDFSVHESYCDESSNVQGSVLEKNHASNELLQPNEISKPNETWKPNKILKPNELAKQDQVSNESPISAKTPIRNETLNLNEMAKQNRTLQEDKCSKQNHISEQSETSKQDKTLKPNLFESLEEGNPTDAFSFNDSVYVPIFHGTEPWRFDNSQGSTSAIFSPDLIDCINLDSEYGTNRIDSLNQTKGKYNTGILSEDTIVREPISDISKNADATRFPKIGLSLKVPERKEVSKSALNRSFVVRTLPLKRYSNKNREMPENIRKSNSRRKSKSSLNFNVSSSFKEPDLNRPSTSFSSTTSLMIETNQESKISPGKNVSSAKRNNSRKRRIEKEILDSDILVSNVESRCQPILKKIVNISTQTDVSKECDISGKERRGSRIQSNKENIDVEDNVFSLTKGTNDTATRRIRKRTKTCFGDIDISNILPTEDGKTPKRNRKQMKYTEKFEFGSFNLFKRIGITSKPKTIRTAAKKIRKGIETTNRDRLQTERPFNEAEITGVRSLPSDEPELTKLDTFAHPSSLSPYDQPLDDTEVMLRPKTKKININNSCGSFGNIVARSSLSSAPDPASDNTDVTLPSKPKKLTIHKSKSGSSGTDSTKNSTRKKKKKRSNGVTRAYRNPTKKKPKQNPCISSSNPEDDGTSEFQPGISHEQDLLNQQRDGSMLSRSNGSRFPSSRIDPKPSEYVFENNHLDDTIRSQRVSNDWIRQVINGEVLQFKITGGFPSSLNEYERVGNLYVHEYIKDPEGLSVGHMRLDCNDETEQTKSTPYIIVYTLLSGKALVKIADRQIPCNPGMIFRIPVGTVYSIKNLSSDKELVLSYVKFKK